MDGADHSPLARRCPTELIQPVTHLLHTQTYANPIQILSRLQLDILANFQPSQKMSKANISGKIGYHALRIIAKINFTPATFYYQSQYSALTN